MASEYTPNYNLDKYVGTDKPNLRDQYNSAMDKIDAQFVVIKNDHTETGNQISAINTNMTQLGERVTAAEGKVTAVEGQISQTNAELADLQGKTRSLVLFEARDSSEGIVLFGGASFWGQDSGTLDAEIPEWANWIDFHFMAMDARFWRQGAAAFADTVSFASPAICQTFPARRLSQPITNFAILLPPLMSVQTDGSAGRQAIGFGNVPFKINGRTVTQNMGIDTTGGSAASFKNSYSGAAMVFNTDTPTYTNNNGSVNLLKVVARA